MLRRTFAIFVLIVTVFAFKGISAWGDDVPAPTIREAVKATTDALEALIDEFKSDGEPLDRIMERIATRYKLKIVMQWDALKKAGIDQKTPIRLTLHSGIHVRELLKQVVRAMGLTVNDSDLLPERSIRDNGEIVVTTHADLYEHFVSTRKYRLSNGGDPEMNMRTVERTKGLVAPDSWVTKPGGVGGKIFVEGNALVVTQTDDNQRFMASVVKPFENP